MITYYKVAEQRNDVINEDTIAEKQKSENEDEEEPTPSIRLSHYAAGKNSNHLESKQWGQNELPLPAISLVSSNSVYQPSMT